jgi:hypothetical protein
MTFSEEENVTKKMEMKNLLQKQYSRGSLGITLGRWSPCTWTASNGVVMGFRGDKGSLTGLHSTVEARVEFLRAEAEAIRCPTCQMHFRAYLKDNKPPVTGDGSDLKEWLFTFHNSVSQRTHHPILPRDELDDVLPTRQEFFQALWGEVFGFCFLYPMDGTAEVTQPAFQRFLRAVGPALPVADLYTTVTSVTYTEKMEEIASSDQPGGTMSHRAPLCRALFLAHVQLAEKDVGPQWNTFESLVEDFAEPRTYSQMGIRDKEQIWMREAYDKRQQNSDLLLGRLRTISDNDYKGESTSIQKNEKEKEKEKENGNENENENENEKGGGVGESGGEGGDEKAPRKKSMNFFQDRVMDALGFSGTTEMLGGGEGGGGITGLSDVQITAIIVGALVVIFIIILCIVAWNRWDYSTPTSANATALTAPTTPSPFPNPIAKSSSTLGSAQVVA